ncbi:hypothetical protein F5Y16DRAFT_425306 [Xylariaceae sp. FL0255]|nr:hypothetical protein F5Y16DRAFT_425306 [Xylariaceae sp. FL0255]
MTSNLRSEAPKRHIACQKCRLRKVKCDGQLPYCKRCASSGYSWDCVYASTSQNGKESQRSDEHALVQVDGDNWRDSEAESAVQMTTLTYNVNMEAPTSRPLSDELHADDQEPLKQDFAGCSGILAPEVEDLDYSISNDQLLFFPVMDSVQQCNTPDITNTFNIEFSSSMVETLLLKYAGSCQGPYFIFKDHRRLSALLLEMSSDTVALRHAICAHAVLIGPEPFVWDRLPSSFNEPPTKQGIAFYDAATSALAQHEKEQQGSSISLRVLQATIMIALYELRCAWFRKAYCSIGRALWITESSKIHVSSLHKGCSPFSDQEFDDALIALWATMGITGFFSLGYPMVGLAKIFETTSQLPIPIPGLGNNTLTMSDIFNRTVTRQLTVHEAMSACGVLLPRVLSHVRTISISEDEISQPYTFWTNHHRLHNTVNYTSSLARIASEAEPALDMLLNAISTMLCDAARQKGRETAGNGLGGQGWSEENATVRHASHISNVVQTRPLSGDSWAAVTGAWSIYVALKSLLYRQKRMASGEAYGIFWNENTRTDHYAAHAPISGCYELNDQPIMLTEASILDSITTLRQALVQLSTSLPLAAFYLSQIDAETSTKGEPPDEVVPGVVDFTTQSPFFD